MNFTAIRLDNAKSLSIDETVPFEKKAMRLFDHKSEILNDLIFIETILEKCVPKSDELNFKKLRAKFNNELSLKLPPTKNDPGKKLDEILKLDRMRNQMRDSVKVLALPVVQPPVSPRTEGMFAVSPRGNKIKLVGLRSNPNSPRSNSASPRDEEPAATSNPSSPRKKMVSVRSEYKSPRNDAVTPRSEAPSPREEKSDRPINPTRPRSPRNK